MTGSNADPWEALEEPSTRTPRTLETRGSDERKRQWQEPTLLPDPTPRDGWKFKWIRTSTRNTPDKQTVEKRFREGWEAVRAEDHPEILAEWRLPADTRGNLDYGGLLLCKMPDEMVQQRNATYLARARAIEQDAEEHYMRDPGDLIKKFQENRRKVMFGR